MFLVFWNFWFALILRFPGFWDLLDFLDLLVAAQCSRRSRSPEAATASSASSASLSLLSLARSHLLKRANFFWKIQNSSQLSQSCQSSQPSAFCAGGDKYSERRAHGDARRYLSLAQPSAFCAGGDKYSCLLYTSPSPRDKRQSRMPSSA